MSGHIGDMVSQHYNTPGYILDCVREVWGSIDLDPCDNEWSSTGARISYKLPEYNGLTDSWLVAPDGSRIQNVFCNPPYGTCYLQGGKKQIGVQEFRALSKEEKGKIWVTSLEDWTLKAINYPEQEIMLLIPSSTETTFWHKNIWPSYTQICFIRGRVKHPLMGKESAASTKGSALVYWGSKRAEFGDAFKKVGHVIQNHAR